MKYKLVTDEYRTDFESKVNKAIKEGWKPIGGVAIISRMGIPTYYYQAMVKEEK